jgi:hypothetical protein
VSTGLFPQEIIISFQSQVIISAIQIYCFNGLVVSVDFCFNFFIFAVVCTVKELIVERSVKADPVDFELVCERGMKYWTDGKTDKHT